MNHALIWTGLVDAPLPPSQIAPRMELAKAKQLFNANYLMRLIGARAQFSGSSTAQMLLCTKITEAQQVAEQTSNEIRFLRSELNRSN